MWPRRGRAAVRAQEERNRRRPSVASSLIGFPARMKNPRTPWWRTGADGALGIGSDGAAVGAGLAIFQCHEPAQSQAEGASAGALARAGGGPVRALAGQGLQSGEFGGGLFGRRRGQLAGEHAELSAVVFAPSGEFAKARHGQAEAFGVFDGTMITSGRVVYHASVDGV